MFDSHVDILHTSLWFSSCQNGNVCTERIEWNIYLVVLFSPFFYKHGTTNGPISDMFGFAPFTISSGFNTWYIMNFIYTGTGGLIWKCKL